MQGSLLEKWRLEDGLPRSERDRVPVESQKSYRSGLHVKVKVSLSFFFANPPEDIKKEAGTNHLFLVETTLEAKERSRTTMSTVNRYVHG